MKLTKWTIINTCFLAIIFVFGFFVIGGTNVFASSREGQVAPLSIPLFYSLFTIFAVGVIAFIIYSIKYREYKPNLILIVFFFLSFIANLITIAVFKDNSSFLVNLSNGKTISFTYTASLVDKSKYIIQFLTLLIISYLIFDTIPKNYDFNVIYFFSFLAILVVIGAIIASLIIDNTKYIEIFSHLGKGDMYEYAATSLFAYRNSYGFVIFLGIIASLFMHSLNHKWQWFIATSIFYLFLAFTICKTALVLGALIILSYLAIRFFLSYKEHKKRNIISFATISILCILGLILVIIYVNRKGLSKFDTIETRVAIWKNVINILKSTNWASGVGFHLFGDILYIFNISDPAWASRNQTTFAHNGLLELLGNGGVILLLAFIVLLFYITYLYVKHFKNHKEICMFGFVLMVVSLIYMVFESGTFIFSATFDYSYLSLMVVLPVLLLENKRIA